jgi:hypothetical protein
MVAWEKKRTFAADDGDLDSEGTGPLSAGLALDGLLRFIDTHASLFERIDDSGGRIPGSPASAFAPYGTTLDR